MSEIGGFMSEVDYVGWAIKYLHRYSENPPKTCNECFFSHEVESTDTRHYFCTINAVYDYFKTYDWVRTFRKSKGCSPFTFTKKLLEVI